MTSLRVLIADDQALVRAGFRMILDAARGSLLQLAWLIEADTGRKLAVNPEHVAALRAMGT